MAALPRLVQPMPVSNTFGDASSFTTRFRNELLCLSSSLRPRSFSSRTRSESATILLENTKPGHSSRRCASRASDCSSSSRSSGITPVSRLRTRAPSGSGWERPAVSARCAACHVASSGSPNTPLMPSFPPSYTRQPLRTMCLRRTSVTAPSEIFRETSLLSI